MQSLSSLSSIAVRFPIISLTRAFLAFSKVKVNNADQFVKLLQQTDRPIITVSNHTSTVDDLIVFNTLPLSIILSNRMRYGLGAKEICFSNSLTSFFFHNANIIPIIRGEGIYQQAVDTAIALMNDNSWVHLFSEGRINTTSQLLRFKLPFNITRFKWGIARIIMESKNPPLIVPIYHHGCDDVLPSMKPPYYPRLGQNVSIQFGDPIDSSSLLEQVELLGLSSLEEKMIHLTRTIQECVEEVKLTLLKEVGNKSN
jgi:monolysocardiolipin acyltransferase